MDSLIVIIGGGPSGLLLSQLPNRTGIATVILERASRGGVLSRIRAGIVEWGSVAFLRKAGVDYTLNDSCLTCAYGNCALARVRKVMRFIGQMTTMLHRFDGADSFAEQMRRATLAHLADPETARRDLAGNNIGLPFRPAWTNMENSSSRRSCEWLM